ncbi:Zinc finger NHR/GATA-type [Penicillium chrysogenum]|uniref:Zinc finger NHR/GATA-type n=1 Tax=Penicillium chrysogenum TaxID=5076 RepID=A0ABQ8WEB0_PENCH|nr:Zinc finger NHR/GATA-type [Penicillium chrysogenum]KAJ5244966.1 Zinc finger NHR/GATA-type [Penicillium chrysogenum]KAJ5264761.1 Zinc finger NHR/GATA-type [Penicillium chrysogenum]KAJ5849188.1 Zinc finger NHR/GATA-type [Penicillium rubens]
MESLEAASSRVLSPQRICQKPNVNQLSIYRDPLPAIGFLGKGGSVYSPKLTLSATASPTPLISTNVVFAGQPLHYSNTRSSAPPQPGYISPREARRAIEDKKNEHTPRQSLPSIHEALGNDNPLSYPAPTSALPPQSAHPAPLTHLIGRPSAEGPAGPPNPFSNRPTTGSLMRQPGFPRQVQLQAEASRSSLTSIDTQDSLNASLYSLSTGKSPTQSVKPGIASVGSRKTSGDEYGAPTFAGSVASPNSRPRLPPTYSFQSQPGDHSYPPAPYDNRPYVGSSRVEEVNSGFVGRPIPPHSDSLKRHLDVYDVETSLNEIVELSTRILNFSWHYAARVHQKQRSGSILGFLPSLNEVEDMLDMQRRDQDALIRIRIAVVNQEQALAKQMAQREAFKTGDEHMAMYQEEFKGTGGFAGADPKKRRGAAPPVRCHSCNRTETPEWRRGPDGARTLCNACGLHHAKLTRKMGNKASSLGPNLKPKSVLDSASPTSH